MRSALTKAHVWFFSLLPLSDFSAPPLLSRFRDACTLVKPQLPDWGLLSAWEGITARSFSVDTMQMVVVGDLTSKEKTHGRGAPCWGSAWLGERSGADVSTGTGALPEIVKIEPHKNS